MYPTCALARESSACRCQRKKTTEMIAKKNSPPGIYMMRAPMSWSSIGVIPQRRGALAYAG